MAILAKVTVGKDFRLTIPKEVREFLELREGNELIFYMIEDEKGRVLLRKI